MSLLAYWVHTPHPFLIRFSEKFGVRWYGLAYLAGFVTAGWLLRRYYRAGRTALKPEAAMDLMLALVVGVMLGGRVGYFLPYQPQSLLADPLAFFRIWEGGMASHGGFIGVLLALWWFSRKRQIRFLHLGDLVTSTVPAGLLFGRLANFVNGELWGKVTDVPWAIIFSATGGGDQPRHPSQLYEAALEGVVLLAYVQWRFWRTTVTQKHPGQLSGEFLIAYAVLRAICEVFREPDASLLFGLSRGTFYSFFLVAGGIALIATARRRPPPRT